MNEQTKKLMLEMATKCAGSQVAYGYHAIRDVYKEGFTAAHELAEKEIADLTASLKSAVEELEELAIEQKFYIQGKDYFHEVVRLNLQAQEAFKDLKSKHPDMFKGGK